MELYYFKGSPGMTNFGDELNPWMWKRLIPEIFEIADDAIFVGIGTLINDRVPKARHIIVFGSGVGYGPKPDAIDCSWHIYCLRGPLSVKALGLSSDLAITDPAVLVRNLVTSTPPLKTHRRAYMPHWQCANPALEKVCNSAGLAFIDPRWEVDRVISEIQKTEVLITEALHGAIVADTLGVPWIPIKTREHILLSKWEDWCASIEIEYQPVRILPMWGELPHGASLQRRMRNRAKSYAVVMQLRRVSASSSPILSERTKMERLVGELERKLDELRLHIKSGKFG